MNYLSIVTAALLLAASNLAHSARPMVTDDARLVDPKSCQVESWAKFNRGSTEFWALPGCNVGENLELTYGGARTREGSEAHTTDTIMQAKTLFRKLNTNDYGVGIVIGHAQHPRDETRDTLIGDAYVYVPVSVSMLDDKFVLHTNVGAIHNRDDHVTKATWGIGSETELSKSTYLIAEVFGESGSRGFHQVGVRYWVIPNRVQIDTTYGNRFANDSDERWLTVGLRLLSAPFLP